MLATILAGFGAGLSLIVAIGPQNGFVLRQGLRGEHLGWVVTICAGSDVVLICLGTAGLEQLSNLAAWALPVMRWGGVAFLVFYGALSISRAAKKRTLDEAGKPTNSDRWPIIATAFALTWLNPHVYLDTVLLLGSLATSHQPNQWWFAIGAMTASCCWFPLLGYGARWLRPVFASPRAWQILDIVIGIVMWAVAASLIW